MRFEKRLWKSLLFDVAFLVVAILLARFGVRSTPVVIHALLFIAQIAAYGYLKWRVLKLYAEPKCGFLSIAISTVALGGALFLFGTLLLWLVKIGIQQSFQNTLSIVIVSVLGVAIYPALQGMHASLARGEAWYTGFARGNKLYLYLLAEAAIFAGWYGLYRLFALLLPWPSLNTIFQLLTILLVLLFNAINRQSLQEQKKIT
ncbi:MAG: hypothetical protein Q7S65_01240 [Nanoarchaeota archaeon]|nr:hypothetical protein [Nanoarchaeota archaeon]